MSWVLDTRSPIHICNSLQDLQVTRRFGEGERFLIIGDGRSVSVLALRIIKLVFKSHYIVLDEYHYYPSFLLNVISVGLLVKSNYEISIKKNFYDIILHGIIILCGQLNNGIYIVSRPDIMYISNKHPRIDDVTDTYLWYCRLGHINKNRINRLTKEEIFDIDDCKLLSICESYLFGRMTKSPFIEKNE